MDSPDRELLKKFELNTSEDFHVFGGDCIEAAGEIEYNYRKSTYDHRPFLPGFASDSPFYTEQYRVGYACFKREVTRVLKPKIILEIGVGVGIGAFAFMSGYPHAHYIGIDNDEAVFPTVPLIKPSMFVYDQLVTKKYSAEVHIEDSQKMDVLPLCDFVHVDGDHTRAAVRHDTALAWNSGAKWILCDDARDSAVVAGIFDALTTDLKRGSVEWAYFPDTWTGSILIRTDHKKEGA